MTVKEYEKSAKLVSVEYQAYCVKCDWKGRYHEEYHIAEEDGNMHEEDEGDDHFTKIRQKTIRTN